MEISDVFLNNLLRKGTFDSLKNLIFLKLKFYNEKDIKDDIFEDDIFDGLKSLLILEISHSILNMLPSASFRNLKKLKNINVSCDSYLRSPTDIFSKSYDNKKSSKIIVLPNKLFANLKPIKSLSLESIGWKELTKNVFANNFEMLKRLSISGYQRDTLPEEIFNNTPNIKVLRIDHNNLFFLPSGIFRNLKKLEFLDLSYNKLFRIDL